MTEVEFVTMAAIIAAVGISLAGIGSGYDMGSPVVVSMSVISMTTIGSVVVIAAMFSRGW